MSHTIKITAKERKKLVTDEYDDLPKYTFTVLDSAKQYTGANQESSVGKMTEIFEEFKRKHPDGGYEEWKKYYRQNYDGDQKLQEATDDAYEMVKNIREAAEQIDREMVFEFLEKLVLRDTFAGQNVRYLIAEKLDEVYDVECYRVPSGVGPDDVHMQAGNQTVSIKPESHRNEGQTVEEQEAVIIYYEDNDSKLEIDVEALDQAL